jgi:hypothetical protein
MTTTFTSIQDWSNSNPSEEIVNKVLDLVNRNIKKSMKLEIVEKAKMISKMQKTMNEMVKFGIEVPKDFQSKIGDLEFEIDNMKSVIEGATKPKREKKGKDKATA